MKNRTVLMLSLAVMLLVGVVIGQSMASPRAEAQQGPRQWRECFAASLWDNNGAAMASPEFRPRTVAVPPGWVPVGGTSGSRGSGASAVICR
jgi:hypothetical protein